MSKRLLTTKEHTIRDTHMSEHAIRVWAYGYIKDTQYMTDDVFYAVIIPNDAIFEGL